MKKQLLLLPFAALVLTGCNNAGTKVDMNVEENVTKVTEKISRNVKTTYNSLSSGISIEWTFSVTDLLVKTPDVEINCDNLSFTASLKANGFDKTIKDWKVAAELKDLNAKVDVKIADVTEAKTFEASNINLGVYLENGNVYAHLGDQNLIALANKVIDAVVPTDQAMFVKIIAAVVLADLKVEDIISFIGISESFKLPEIDDETFAEIKKTVSDLFEELKKLPEGSSFDVIDFDDDGISLDINYATNLENNETVEGVAIYERLNAKANGSISFDSTGNLSKVSSNEEIDMLVKEDNALVVEAKGKVQEEVIFTFGAIDIVMPDFTNYVDLPLESIIEMLPSIIGSLDINLGVGPEYDEQIIA